MKRLIIELFFYVSLCKDRLIEKELSSCFSGTFSLVYQVYSSFEMIRSIQSSLCDAEEEECVCRFLGRKRACTIASHQSLLREHEYINSPKEHAGSVSKEEG